MKINIIDDKVEIDGMVVAVLVQPETSGISHTLADRFRQTLLELNNEDDEFDPRGVHENSSYDDGYDDGYDEGFSDGYKRTIKEGATTND